MAMVPGSIPKIIFVEFCNTVAIFTKIIYLHKSIKILFNWFLGPIIFIILSWSLYKQIVHQPDVASRWLQIKQSFQNPLLWGACMLVFINWGIEARKWQIQLRPLEKMSFLTAFKSVLAGCSITMLTPYRVGEYGGRILYVQEENRIDAIPLTILGSISQLFVTVMMGIGGLMYLKFIEHNEQLFSFLPSYSVDILLGITILAAFMLLLIYLRVSVIVKILSSIPSFAKFVSHITLLNTFSRKQLLRILFLSFIRYTVFILQYILLLQALQVQISFFTCYWLITVFYLLMALAPTIGFTELPIRASASVALLQVYSNNTIGIQAASLGIFIINLVVPAVIGSILIFGIKILKEK
jgi:Lysylphosphatidylglycerol synthase TM region